MKVPALNTDPQRDSVFTDGPANVLDHAGSEILLGSKLGSDAMERLPGDVFKRPWPALIKMDESAQERRWRSFSTTAGEKNEATSPHL